MGRSWGGLRRVRVAGGVLLFAGVCWLLGGLALAYWLVNDSPIQTTGSHGMLPSDLYSKVFGILAGAASLAAAVPLVIGFCMLRGQRWAAIAAIPLGLLAMIYGGSSWLQGGVPAQISLALPGAVIASLPLSAFLNSELDRRAFGHVGWQNAVRWLSRPVQSVATLLVVFAALTYANQLTTRFGSGGSEWDSGPITQRSDLSLALQCSKQLSRPGAECAELAQRAPAAASSLARAVHKCSGHIARGSSDSSGDEACAGWRIRGMFTLLGQQRAEEGFVELERWVKRSDADLWLRAAAARGLAQGHDERALALSTRLLEQAGTDDEAHEDLIETVHLLRGAAATPLLRKVLLQRGPQSFGRRSTLRAIAEADTEESWQTITELANSPDRAWRRSIAAAFTGWPTSVVGESIPPLPISERVRRLMLDHFDDEDATVRLQSCRVLLPCDRTDPQTRAALSDLPFSYQPCRVCDTLYESASAGTQLRKTLEERLWK